MKLFLFSILFLMFSHSFASFIQNEDVKSEAQLISDGGVKAQLINDTKIYITSVAKTLEEAIADGDISGGGGTGALNLLEDPSFEDSATEGSITGGSQSLNASTILATPNNANSLELNFNNVTGNYILEKNTSAQFEGVQGIVSVWIKNAKAGVKLIPRINGADSTALSIDVKIDDKWNEYVIPAVIGTTSFGFKVDVTASNAGSLFIDEAYVGAMPATMTPEVAQAEYFGGLTAVGATDCNWTSTSTSFANFASDSDCNEFTEIGNIKKPSTKIPGLIIPAGSPSGTYKIVSGFRGACIPTALDTCFLLLTDGAIQSNTISIRGDSGAGNSTEVPVLFDWSYEYTTEDTDILIQMQSAVGSGTVSLPAGSSIIKYGFDVYYYPPKSKIYSNNSMGWYVDVNIGGGANSNLDTSSVSTYTSISNDGLDMVINSGSQPAEIPCSGTNPSTGITCSAGDEQIGVVFDVPSVGAYEVCITFTHQLSVDVSSDAITVFQMIETPNNAQTNLQLGKTFTESRSVGTTIRSPHTNCAVFKFNSVGKKTVRLMYEQLVVSGTVVNSRVIGHRLATQGQSEMRITVKPFVNNEQITASFKQIDDAIQSIPNQNYVINGNFDFWQRGTSLGADIDIRYLADRFATESVVSTYAVSRQAFTIGQAEVPNNPKFFHRVVATSSAGAGNYVAFQQRIEDVTLLAGKTVTLSFWAKADASKQMSIEFGQNFGTGGSPSPNINFAPQKINLTTSWQKFTRAVLMPTVTGATLGTDNNDFLRVFFWFDAGSSFNSRTDSLGHQSGTFDIAQVKLEEGSVATPFVLAGGTLAGELANCQRYYEKSYNVDTAVGTITSTGAITYSVSTPFYLSNQVVSFKTPKRISATVTAYGTTAGTAGIIEEFNSGGSLIAGRAAFIYQQSQTGFAIGTAGVFAATAGNFARCQWTAEAEL